MLTIAGGIVLDVLALGLLYAVSALVLARIMEPSARESAGRLG